MDEGKLKNRAFYFIILMGVVSLFGDMTYEGARGVIGPYFAVLGASALAVGLISGLSEFIGYFIRFIVGFLSDRLKLYWFFTLSGYALIFAIPLIGLTKTWHFAAVFIVLERLGKALRSPARDAILSKATKLVGRGTGFGIHEAMDQIGAVIGPLIFSAVFFYKGNYSTGFLFLFIPAILMLATLLYAKKSFKLAEKMESGKDEGINDSTDINTFDNKNKNKLPKIFWIYTIFIFFSAAGFVNYQIISYHVERQHLLSYIYIPALYSMSMLLDAVSALITGRIYDKKGLKTLITIPVFTILIPFFAFFSNIYMLIFSIAIWGILMGIHETIMRAAIADMTPPEKRGTAYGIFNTVYGVAFFVGGIFIGYLYNISIYMIIAYVVVTCIITFLLYYKYLSPLHQKTFRKIVI